MALDKQQPSKNLIHHSDRGSTYTATDYQDALRNIAISMSRKGNCWGSAVAESFFAKTKKEFISHCHCRARRDATASILNTSRRSTTEYESNQSWDTLAQSSIGLKTNPLP
jgi:putative transposase